MTFPFEPIERKPKPRERKPDVFDVRTNRVVAQSRPENMKTYQIRAPKKTHFRVATCEEIECPNFLYGWKTIVDPSTDIGRAQRQYIKNDTTRKATSYRREDSLVEFTFEAGQTCFQTHYLRLDNEALYLVKGGDWRGNPRGEALKQHANADDWVDDFANNQLKLIEIAQRG